MKPTTLQDAVRGTLARWDAAKGKIDGLCVVAAVHGIGYDGPNLGEAMESLHSALAADEVGQGGEDVAGWLRKRAQLLRGILQARAIGEQAELRFSDQIAALEEAADAWESEHAGQVYGPSPVETVAAVNRTAKVISAIAQGVEPAPPDQPGERGHCGSPGIHLLGCVCKIQPPNYSLRHCPCCATARRTDDGGFEDCPGLPRGEV